MNFRSTAILFALLLTMLWGFGLMLATKRGTAEEDFVLPSLQDRDIAIDSLVIERRGKGKDNEKLTFTKIDDDWRLSMPGASQSVKVDRFKVDQIVSQVREARQNEEADVSRDLAFYQL